MRTDFLQPIRSNFVIPANAGIQLRRPCWRMALRPDATPLAPNWIPANAGMTTVGLGASPMRNVHRGTVHGDV